jgi:hypothetical protein
MSTLLKALKRAEQDRREKLQAAGQSSAAAAPTQLSLPVDADDEPAHPDAVTPADAGERAAAQPAAPRVNPLLVPKPVQPAEPAQPRHAGVAVLVGAATLIAIGANVLYRPAPPDTPVLAAAPAASIPLRKLETVSIPPSLLGAGPVPLQLQLDRHVERLFEHRGDPSGASTARQ